MASSITSASNKTKCTNFSTDGDFELGIPSAINATAINSEVPTENSFWTITVPNKDQIKQCWLMMMPCIFGICAVTIMFVLMGKVGICLARLAKIEAKNRRFAASKKQAGAGASCKSAANPDDDNFSLLFSSILKILLQLIVQ